MTAAAPRGALVRMIIGAALISTTSIFVRWAHVAPTTSAFYRMFFGGLMLVVLLAVRRQWRPSSIADVAVLLLPSLAFAIDLMMWHRSILYIGPGLATLVGNFQVFVMAAAGVIFYRERLGLRFALGLALAIFGLWLLVGMNWHNVGADYRIGVLLGVLTGFAYAIYMLSLRRAQMRRPHLASAQVLCMNSLLCAGILGIALLAEDTSFAIPDTQSWFALIGVGLFGQVLGWVLIVEAMPQLPASLVGLLLLLQPGISFVLDVLLFSRSTTTQDWLGLVISLAGIFVASSRPRAPAPAASNSVQPETAKQI